MEELIGSTGQITNVVLDSIAEAVIIVNPKDRIIRSCNSATTQIFGYKKEELVGRQTAKLHVNQEYYDVFGKLSERVLNLGQVYRGEFQMKRKDGSIINTCHTVTPIQKEYGWEEGVVSVIRDISDQRKVEKQVENNLKEKINLLEEVHHRVKNNLALIASLLYLQMEESVNELERKSLKVAYSRLQSIALVHEQLYQKAETGTNINLGSYIPELVDCIHQTIGLSDKKISTDIEANHISIPLAQAIPAGLMMSELLINAYKHAFKNRHEGRIKVNISAPDSDHIQIKVSDNGVGLPEDFTLNDGSVGMSIIQTLASQLDGNLNLTSTPEAGTRFSVSFPKNAK